MVLTQSQHENNSKEELIQDLTKINSSPVNDINAKLSDLSDMFNKFTSKFDKVYSKLQLFMKMFWRRVLVKHCH